jgi:hypothetical protein
MSRGALVFLLFFLPSVAGQAAATTNTTDCSWSFADQMGSGGGILMFFLGFMTGALVVGIVWLLMDQRWRSWHVFSRGGGTPNQYTPMYPQGYPGADPSQPQGYPPAPTGYPPGYPPQQAFAWPAQGGYQTHYEVIVPGHR